MPAWSEPAGRLLDVLLGAGGGVVASIVTLRTRFALQDAREKTLHERLDRIDGRQLVTLQLLADMASALKLDKRFSDALVKYLADTRDRAD